MEGKTHTISAKAISALRQGNKIEAIKIARLEHNIGLKEAKEAVEEFLDKNPTINERLKENSSGGLGGLIFIIIIIAVVAYYFLQAGQNEAL